VFNIAQAYRLRGDCANAVASYKKFVALDPTSSERADAEGFIKDLEPCPVVAQKPAVDARPINGAPAGNIGGPSEHPGRTKKYVAIGVGIAGLALVATGAIYGRKASSIADDIKADCADGCLWDDIRDQDADGRSAERNQYIFLGAGVAAAATAGVLYWLGNKEHGSRPSAVAITPRTEGGLTLSFARRF
jgi:hypothetical protein